MKKVDIETLLRWAYREELPKDGTTPRGPDGYLPGWCAVGPYGELGTMVDRWRLNNFGVIIDPAATENAHPDAVCVAKAVRSLSEFEVEMPDDWNPADDLGDLGVHGRAAVVRCAEKAMKVESDGRRWLKKAPERLIVYHAVVGGVPDWHVDPPVVEMVKKNGKPAWFRKQRIPDATDADGNVISWREIEADGFNKKSRRPFDDAYRKYALEPDPVLGLIGRAEYEVWRAALDVIVEEIDGKLLDHICLPSKRPWRPWEEGESPQRRVLMSRLPESV